MTFLREKLVFIGGGNMAEALVKGMLEAGLLSSSQILISDKDKKRLQYWKEKLGIPTTEENAEGVRFAEVVILAVKPPTVDDALQSCLSAFTRDKLLISIVAGTTTSYLENIFPHPLRVVRVMPNLPVLVREGISALATGRYVQKEDVLLTENIFRAVGEVVIVPENLMEAVTGLSGSGPAYVFVILEALADAGVLEGLPREMALKLAIQTVIGASRMAQLTGEHPAVLKDRVTSPGGTTIAGLQILETEGLRGTIMKAVAASTQRARDLKR